MSIKEQEMTEVSIAEVSLRAYNESKTVLPPPTTAEVTQWRDQECGFNAAVFWRQCNTAGCTEAIFNDFLNYMKDMSERIQHQTASKEDYDVALKVMMASGKITQMLSKQQKELEKKQMAVQKSMAAMQDVVSLLRR
ncbi:uncharacterized protein phf11 [Corythoichthys intestinalis]|uniref:uncharacterized protein phf11 n=1 Tax=Corythoichthys intestinalis TaxID=161448 RepID=UPI0025A55F67|nr:uncharacterized protein phf11 [Corythoichthys intestinalis]